MNLHIMRHFRKFLLNREIRFSYLFSKNKVKSEQGFKQDVAILATLQLRDEINSLGSMYATSFDGFVYFPSDGFTTLF